MHGKNLAEQNKLYNTYGMTHCLGEIQNRTQRRGKSTENCNHNNYKRKMILKTESQYIVIESIPCSTEIRFPKKQGRKSQMPTKKIDSQDQSSISNSNSAFNLQNKWL